MAHFYELPSHNVLNSLPFIGGYSWWQSVDGFNARAWFTKDMFAICVLPFRFEISLSTLSEMKISNAALPTRREDVLALFSRNLTHVTIQRDAFGRFSQDDYDLRVPQSRPNHSSLSSFLGSVYEIGEVIGKGGFGEVFKATRTIHGKATIIALKVFSQKSSESDVRAEFAVLQRLQH